MASWLSAAVFSLCIGGKLFSGAPGDCPEFPEKRALRVDVRSLAQLCPEPGDWVVLDIDDTLIMPVHSIMASEREGARAFWRPILRDRFESTLSRAWCCDRRRLAEPVLARLCKGWRSQGVVLMALTSRQRLTPHGSAMDQALVQQLKELGIPLKISHAPESGQLFDGELLCTHGSSKVPYCMALAERGAQKGPGTLWLVDDRLEPSWESQRLSAASVPLCVVHVQRLPASVVSPMLEQLEFGYWLKTGRWPQCKLPNTVRGIGLTLRGNIQGHRIVQKKWVARRMPA